MNIWRLLFEEVLIGANLKFGVSPSSKKSVEKNAAAESEQDLQIKILRAIKKAATF